MTKELDLVTATKLVKDHANSIWSEIGYDVLQACGEDELDRCTVIEIVIDRFEDPCAPEVMKAARWLNAREFGEVSNDEVEVTPTDDGNLTVREPSVHPLGKLTRQAIESAFTADAYTF
jgi:hypothetical protein